MSLPTSDILDIPPPLWDFPPTREDTPHNVVMTSDSTPQRTNQTTNHEFNSKIPRDPNFKNRNTRTIETLPVFTETIYFETLTTTRVTVYSRNSLLPKYSPFFSGNNGSLLWT
jgi:hypothetical protein